MVRRILEHGQRPVEGAQTMGVNPRTGCPRDLHEASARPARRPHLLSKKSRQQVGGLRRERRIYRAISDGVGVPVRTVARFSALA